jgi:hypothetical protein
MSDPFAPLPPIGKGLPGVGNGGAEATAPKPEWIPVVPVPADAPPPPAEHYKLGKPSATWTYRDASGDALGYALRFDTAAGKNGPGAKEFRPLTLWRPAAGGKPEWRWESWPINRPLYGLEKLAKRPEAPVAVCEGEKSADAATRLLPSFVAVTSSNGSKNAGKADWSPLRGRAVTVWPDADSTGLDYARQVAKLAVAAGAASVAIVVPPEGAKSGWDAADAEAEGWHVARAAALIAAAKPFAPASGRKARAQRQDGESGDSRAPVPQRDLLIELADAAELWHDNSRNAYASFTVKDHRENWPIRSRDFKMWTSPTARLRFT